MKVKIQNKIISEKSKTFVVGEIGLNHDGKIKNCIKLIDHAKKAGFDAIKLQISDPNESYYPKSKSHLIFKKNSLTDKQLEKVVYHAKKILRQEAIRANRFRNITLNILKVAHLK